MTVSVLDYAAVAARCTISAIFVGMGVVHFLPKPMRMMARMIPPSIVSALGGSASFLVVFTGVCEVAGGVGVLIPQTRWLAGVMLAIFCVCVFPANIYASQHPEKFGKYSIPLVKRLPAQIALIALILWSCTSQYSGL